MPLVPYVDEASAPPEIREMLEQSALRLNVLYMVCNSEAAARAFFQLGNRLMTRAKLDARLRELAILRVASTSESTYEWTQHVPLAKSVGISDEEMAAIGEWEQASCFGELDQLVLRLTDEVSVSTKGSPATVTALEARLGAAAMVELVLSIGYWRMAAGLLNTTEVELEEFAGKVNIVPAPRRPVIRRTP